MYLFRQIGVNMNSQLIILRAVYGSLGHNQFPKLVFLSRGQGRITIQNMLRGWDNLRGGLFFLIAFALLTKKVCFCDLQLPDLLRQSGVSFGEHVNSVNTLFQILANGMLLRLQSCKLCPNCFQRHCHRIFLRLFIGSKMNGIFFQPLIHTCIRQTATARGVRFILIL